MELSAREGVVGLIGCLPGEMKVSVVISLPGPCARGSETAKGGAVMGCNLHSLDSKPLDDRGWALWLPLIVEAGLPRAMILLASSKFVQTSQLKTTKTQKEVGGIMPLPLVSL